MEIPEIEFKKPSGFDDDPPHKKLDMVLGRLLLKDVQERTEFNIASILGTDIKNIRVILLKLIKDGYVTSDKSLSDFDIKIIESKPVKINELTPVFNLTFEGEVFISEGGYDQQEADRQSLLAEQENLKTIEKRLREIAVAQNRRLIYAGTLAAIFAGGLLAWDIIKFLFEKDQVLSYIALYFLVILGYNLFRKIR